MVLLLGRFPGPFIRIDVRLISLHIKAPLTFINPLDSIVSVFRERSVQPVRTSFYHSKLNIRKLIIFYPQKVMTSFRENVVHPIKTAQVQMKENLTVKMDNFKDGMERSKGQMIIKMDYLKDGMILRMDNVRRRLSNNTRRE